MHGCLGEAGADGVSSIFWRFAGDAASFSSASENERLRLDCLATGAALTVSRGFVEGPSWPWSTAGDLDFEDSLWPWAKVGDSVFFSLDFCFREVVDEDVGAMPFVFWRLVDFDSSSASSSEDVDLRFDDLVERDFCVVIVDFVEVLLSDVEDLGGDGG